MLKRLKSWSKKAIRAIKTVKSSVRNAQEALVKRAKALTNQVEHLSVKVTKFFKYGKYIMPLLNVLGYKKWVKFYEKRLVEEATTSAELKFEGVYKKYLNFSNSTDTLEKEAVQKAKSFVKDLLKKPRNL